MAHASDAALRSSQRLPPVVRRLGWASLLNDVSSELVAALLPLHLAALGVAGLGVGLVGGLEEAARSLLSVATGWSSDRLRTRRPFLWAGYGLSAAAKTALAATTSWGQVVALRITDRAGKAVRTPARDALIASAVSASDRGRAFGVHRAFDTTGAVIGALLALAAVALLRGDSLRPALLAGGLLGFLSLLPLLRLPGGARSTSEASDAPARGARRLSRRLRRDIAAVSLFSAARLSYLFFLLAVNRSYTDQWALGMPVAMYLLFHVVHAALAAPLGRLSDRVGRGPVLVGGFLAFAATAAGFAVASATPAFVALFALYGVAIAATEGNTRALISDHSGESDRGTALGALETSSGLAALAGNVAAGLLMDAASPAAAFTLSATLATTAALLLRAGTDSNLPAPGRSR